MLKMSILVVFCGLLPCLTQAQSDSKKKETSLEQRLSELEKRQAEMYIQSIENKGLVRSFLGENITFGGFFDSGIVEIHGPDMYSQTSVNSNVLGLNVAAEINDNLRFVSQTLMSFTISLQNPNNNPNVSASKRQYSVPVLAILVAQGYVEYTHSEALKIQSGLGYVPFGHAFQLREPVLFKRRFGPQMMTTSTPNALGVVFPLWMGVHIHGAHPLADDKGRIGYNLYTFSPLILTKSLGVGSRIWWAPTENITAGISNQYVELSTQTSNTRGADLNLKSGRYGITLEYAENKLTNGDPTIVSYYAEPYVTFKSGKYIAYLVADYLNNPAFKVGTKSDAFKIWRMGGGFNWLPVPSTRFRLGVLKNGYYGDTAKINGQARDYYNIDLSVGIAF